MKHISLLISAVALFSLSGCATITAESDQLIELSTTPPGANCVLSNSQGSYTIATTPGSVIVPRMFEPLGVSCSLAGYAPVGTTLEAKTRGRAYGNILLLGLPAIVDASTGAGYEYEPARVNLTLAP